MIGDPLDSLLPASDRVRQPAQPAATTPAPSGQALSFLYRLGLIEPRPARASSAPRKPTRKPVTKKRRTTATVPAQASPQAAGLTRQQELTAQYQATRNAS